MGLHLMEKQAPNPPSYPVPGGNLVESVRYTDPAAGSNGRVWLNKSQYFDGVEPEVWSFHVGGYQVCDKWLKDRKGRVLGYDDITHYRNVVAALRDTIRLMNAIDDFIERHGGFPLT